MTKTTLLLVDDEVRILRSLKVLFRGEFRVLTATSAREAYQIVRQEKVHVLVSDQRMPEITGVALLKNVKEISPNTMRILLTGYSDISAIVSSINEGEVFRYIKKPWDRESIKQTVLQAAEISKRLLDSQEDGENIEVANTQAEGILVLDDLLGVSLVVEKILNQKHAVFRVKTLEDAIKVLSTESIALIIADVRPNNSNNATLLKILKRENPMMVAIAVADQADAQTAIDLINQGQVFRYISKLDPAVLKLAVWSALRYFRRCKSNPTQVLRNRVNEATDPEASDLRMRIKNHLPLIRRKMISLIKDKPNAS